MQSYNKNNEYNKILLQYEASQQSQSAGFTQEMRNEGKTKCEQSIMGILERMLEILLLPLFKLEMEMT